jgi:hypothetical protein
VVALVARVLRNVPVFVAELVDLASEMRGSFGTTGLEPSSPSSSRAVWVRSMFSIDISLIDTIDIPSDVVSKGSESATTQFRVLLILSTEFRSRGYRQGRDDAISVSKLLPISKVNIEHSGIGQSFSLETAVM